MIAYFDASALGKLVVGEAESAALAAWLTPIEPVASSRLAVIEVHRAARVANPGAESAARTRGVLESCLLVDATADVVDTAARLASARLRSLDAIHLATALRLGPDALVAYDARLAEAARARGLTVLAPA